MEAFSFLKYWRTPRDSDSSQPASTTDDDDGPFFDLEFAEEDDEGNKEEEQNGVASSSSDDEDDDDDRGFNLTLSSGSSNDNVTLSPSDELFFKGRLVPVLSGSESDSKPQFSLLKSATKLRVFINKLKPPKQQLKQEINPLENASQQQTTTSNSKLFTIKFKVEEVPMLSLFTRDNSKNTKTMSFQKQSANDSSVSNYNSEDPVSQSVMNKYLKKVKPLYIKVSKMKFSTAAEVDVKTGQKQGSFPGGLRVVSKHLGKSRSASSAAVAAAPMPVSKRRDDSLLQQQDGIQSAILHCKRSFNASTDSESLVLSRSVSDSSHEKSMEFSGKKQGEAKGLRVTEENPKKAGNVA